jgi:formylmethanofuran dehydrogenase subunit E
MNTFEEYVEMARIAHGHICAGQILGVRMAMYGVGMLGLDDPAGKDRKRLVTYVEIDRCATDALGVVTGCRLGKRALKFRDWGKMAATFCDLSEDRAVRVVALETSKDRARELYPDIENKNEQQLKAYRAMPDSDLFSHEWARVRIGPEETPGYKAPRIQCAACGEGINFHREVIQDGRVLCKACAGERYWEPLEA